MLIKTNYLNYHHSYVKINLKKKRLDNIIMCIIHNVKRHNVYNVKYVTFYRVQNIDRFIIRRLMFIQSK